MKKFKLILKSLISNNACIDGGKNNKWYLAILLFLFSMVVALVPTFVKSIKTNGDDMFKNGAYGVETGVTRFLEDAKTKSDLSMIVSSKQDGDNYLAVMGWDISYPDELHSYQHTHKELKTTTQEGQDPITQEVDVIDFLVSYRDKLDEETLNKLQGKADSNDSAKWSVMIFTQEEFYLSVVNQNTKESLTNVACASAYKYMNDDYNILNMLSSGTPETSGYFSETFTNFKDFVRKAYNKNRLTGLWQTCLLMGGINIVVTVLMGFMIWVLCRGKNNPYRIFKFWECQKMAYWCTISPALLTCGLGFLLAQFAQILFPLLVGIRVMWLSMKSLRPDGTGYAAN